MRTNAMTTELMDRRTGPEHASAVRRLEGARDEQSRLATLLQAAVGTAAEPLARERLSAGRAYVAARREWLHWIDEGESLAPWADGVWAPEAPREVGDAVARERQIGDLLGVLPNQTRAEGKAGA
jgi:hypothetical protein